MEISGWWKCACCPPPPTHAPGLATETLQLSFLPASPMTPLVFVCGRCARSMIQCESCWTLVPLPTAAVDDDAKADDTVACRRCGFLLLADAAVRALLQLPPWRDAGGTLWRAVPLAESVRLQQRLEVLAAELRALRADGGASPSPSGEAARLRGQQELATHEARHLALAHKLALQSNPLRTATQPVQQSFSAAQLHFLRVMYDSSAEHAALVDAVPAIERFLANQSTLLQSKFDLLAAYRAYLLGQQLATEPFAGASTADAASIVRSYWAVQMQQRCSSFHARADRHLPVVAAVNAFLRPLYAAARELEREMKQQHSADADADTDAPTDGDLTLAVSPLVRKRRRFSGSREAAGSGGGSASGDLAATGQSGERRSAEVARVQRRLELHARIADVAKKVELWRALSFAVASAAVVSVEEAVAAAAQ